jgi:hypothetical protein
MDLQIFYLNMHNQISNVMDISKSLIEELKLLIQLKENIGDSKENSIKLNRKYKDSVVMIENLVIDLILIYQPWRKNKQSLIFDMDNVYDLIEVNQMLDNGEIKKHEFWFDITECFGK